MKAFKKTLALFLAFLMIASTGVALTFNTSAEEGEITPLEPESDGIYYIDDAADMLAFGQAVASTSWFYGKTAKLRADIDMKGVTWTRITSLQSATIDGQGYAIRNLHVNGNGMFANIRGVTIKNISFINATSYGTSPNIIAHEIWGAGHTTFENVYLNATYTVSASQGSYGIGGFVNHFRPDSGQNITFDRCVSDVTIIGGNKLAVGGFLGYSNDTNSTANFIDCAFVGDLTEATADSATTGVAGFIGGVRIDNVNFTRCLSLGNLKSTDYSFCNMRYSQSTMTFNDCYGSNGDIAEMATTASMAAKLSLNYGGENVYSATTATSDYTGINNAFRNVDFANVTESSFATSCPALATSGKWTVTYQGAIKVLPTSIVDMLTLTDAKALQIRDNGDTYDVRIAGTVNFTDMTAYDAVGFDYVVKVKGATTEITSGNFETTKVFSSIIANSETVKASDPEIGATAFNLIEFYEFGDDGVTYEITVLSYAKKDDVKTYNLSGAFTVCVKDGALAN